MDSQQIINCLKNVECFKGVYPRDCLPKNIKDTPAAFIVNTDSSDETGEHWVAIFIPKRSIGEYFDPFGLPPLHEDFTFFLNNNCENWVYNSLPVQHHESKACGKFCIGFIKARNRRISFSDFVSDFSVNLSRNEAKINKQWNL